MRKRNDKDRIVVDKHAGTPGQRGTAGEITAAVREAKHYDQRQTAPAETHRNLAHRKLAAHQISHKRTITAPSRKTKHSTAKWKNGGKKAL